MPDGNSTDLMIQKGDVCSFQDFKDWFNEAPHQRTVAWGKVDFLGRD